MIGSDAVVVSCAPERKEEPSTVRLFPRKPKPSSPLMAHCQTALTTLRQTVDVRTIGSPYHLAHALARHRQKALAVIPYDLPASIDGAWLEIGIPLDADTDLAVDAILLARDASVVEQEHVLLHEIAHMLLGHSAAVGRAEMQRCCSYLDLDAVLGDPGLMQSALCRSRYDTLAEQEAETLATLIASEVIFLPQETDTVVAPWIGVFDRTALYHHPADAMPPRFPRPVWW